MPVEATPLSRALFQQRTARNMTPQQVAKATKREMDHILNYERGVVRPTPLTLARLGEVLGRDFAAEFPLPGTSAKELLKPDNVRGRLIHLIGLVAGGVQRRLSAASDELTDAAVSNAVTGRAPLSSQQLAALCRLLPGLSSSWLTTGKGEPFAGGLVPALVPIAAGKVPTQVPAKKTRQNKAPRDVIPVPEYVRNPDKLHYLGLMMDLDPDTLLATVEQDYQGQGLAASAVYEARGAEKGGLLIHVLQQCKCLAEQEGYNSHLTRTLQHVQAHLAVLVADYEERLRELRWSMEKPEADA